MPTFQNPTADAAEASEALRGLAHASRVFEDPADTYTVLGDLLAGVRSLHQVLDQLATAHVTHRVRAHDDAGDQSVGATYALAATRDLQQAAELLDGVLYRVDQAMVASGQIAWHPEPTVPPSVSRWVSVVFLQGQDADEVLAIIDRDGTDAAIEHLAGYDYGEDTVQAALVNGYVYDTPPTGALDKTATRDVYTLTYSPFLGHVGLLRQHDAIPDPALLDIDTSKPVPHPGHDLSHAASNRSLSRRARRQEMVEEDDEWGPSRSGSVPPGRSL
ncbi:hypothetical protein [Leucobacter triazinivorans]|uniref:Uncharacterized protein n=1 Tax=Leucobacter triazinivorans TaxID=1784719 RepID=A0A4P6KGQ7_9MICO|nr:hypothetical protein [Leucobacter triazinivorans]QBE49685.1 hypothetical protein EVS81_13335 [Leucobacter triazinivorans]